MPSNVGFGLLPIALLAAVALIVVVGAVAIVIALIRTGSRGGRPPAGRAPFDDAVPRMQAPAVQQQLLQPPPPPPGSGAP